jgi:Lipoprotein NlpI, contains TPR repeats
MEENIKIDNDKLNQVCETVRELIKQNKLCEGEELISQTMAKYPHAPEPHNLMGILLENENDHPAAMKHFRAAWALDPTYLPARYNMEQYADFFGGCHKDAYTENDCPRIQVKELYKIEYDQKGIGHMVKRDKNNTKL